MDSCWIEEVFWPVARSAAVVAPAWHLELNRESRMHAGANARDLVSQSLHRGHKEMSHESWRIVRDPHNDLCGWS